MQPLIIFYVSCDRFRCQQQLGDPHWLIEEYLGMWSAVMHWDITCKICFQAKEFDTCRIPQISPRWLSVMCMGRLIFPIKFLQHTKLHAGRNLKVRNDVAKTPDTFWLCGADWYLKKKKKAILVSTSYKHTYFVFVTDGKDQPKC